MAERKIGSAIVVEGEKVVGLFTTVDALRALVALLQGRERPAATPAKRISTARRARTLKRRTTTRARSATGR